MVNRLWRMHSFRQQTAMPVGRQSLSAKIRSPSITNYGGDLDGGNPRVHKRTRGSRVERQHNCRRKQTIRHLGARAVHTSDASASGAVTVTGCGKPEQAPLMPWSATGQAVAKRMSISRLKLSWTQKAAGHHIGTQALHAGEVVRELGKGAEAPYLRHGGRG